MNETPCIPLYEVNFKGMIIAMSDEQTQKKKLVPTFNIQCI